MGKKTDYKRLWRKLQKENMKLSQTITNLKQIIEGQVDMLTKVRDGKIDPKEILK